MLFNSYEFIFFFLPITFTVYFWLHKKRLSQISKGWLVFASLFFYSCWNIIYLPLILGSILFNFLIGSSITSINTTTAKKVFSSRFLLLFGIVANVSLLIYYKYMDFFIANTNLFLDTNWSLTHIILPLGISFFTFTQIAYLVDAYRNEVKEMDYLNYTLFVTFFPHLLAGPILHHKEMMPQFDALKNKVIQYKNISIGLFLFGIGLFKKVIIADTFAQWANIGFNTDQTLHFLEAWATSLSYTFQLYFDFSGYTDMALGVALLFNIRLPVNFNSPYKALNIQDFWRRWHITLSRFLRDYIYIPLGGNQKGELSTYTNLFTVFLIGGLWHGAGWMFIIWGALHGSAIVLHRVWQKLNIKISPLIAWFITFNFVNVTWIFFRAEDISSAIRILKGMLLGPIVLTGAAEEAWGELRSFGFQFGDFALDFATDTRPYGWLLAAFIFIFLPNSQSWLQRFRPTKIYLIFSIVLLLYASLHLAQESEFLYFNF